MLIRIALVLTVAVVLTGCHEAARSKAVVVATTPQVADFVRNVAADEVEVHQLLRVGTDPHEYEPSPADLEALRTATLVFENGAGLEGWIQPAVSASGSRADVVVATAGITLLRELGGEPDPHVWHDPTNAARMVSTIEAALVAALPSGADRFHARATAYRAQLDDLDREVAAAIDLLPAGRRKVVTNHDALAYFARRYGLTIVGSVIPSADSQAELSGRSLRRLAASIREEQVVAVFAESSLPSKAARALSADAGVRVVSGADSLYADSMGGPGTDGATYLTMVRHNARVLVDNLR